MVKFEISDISVVHVRHVLPRSERHYKLVCYCTRQLQAEQNPNVQ